MKCFSKEIITFLALLFCFPFPSRSIECRVPQGLEAFSLMNVLEIKQDSIGSMWLSTTRGLYRYNGHSLDRLSDELPRHSLFYDGGQYLFVTRKDVVTRFNIYDLSSEDFAPGSNEVSKVIVGETPEYRTPGGLVFCGIPGGGFSVTGPEGGIVEYHSCERKNISSVRGIVGMDDGVVYIGTANGLYSYPEEGKLKSEPVASIVSCPVCCLFKDRDGRLWIGTYHNGVFVSSPSTYPFTTIDSSLRGLMTNGTVMDGNGRVHIFTDGQGVLDYDPGTNLVVRNSAFAPSKYQGAWYDSDSGTFWAAVFREGLVDYSGKGRLLSQVDFAPSLGVRLETITPICRYGDDLLIGGSDGLYAFRPRTEKLISRKIEGIEGLVYHFTEAPDGKIWIASGNGVYVYDDGGVRKVCVGNDPDGWENTQPCYGIGFAPDGGVWLGYARKGVVLMNEDGCRYYNAESAGLQDDYIYAVCVLSNGNAVVSTASGLSVIGDSVLNYPFTMVDAIQDLGNDRLLLCSRDGVLEFKGRNDLFELQAHDVRIDRVLIDGNRFSGHEMKYYQNNISFDLTTFSYSSASPVVISTFLEGFDEKWTTAGSESPILYRRLDPGKYTFRVKARTIDGRSSSEDSFTFRIRPPWYSTTVVRLGMVLLVLLVGATLLYFVSSRQKLTYELRKKEAENRERTRFFVDLSYKIRTPLNLIVSKLERYFKDYGSRSAGSENIEDIYFKSRELRGMVSAFVDSQNDGSGILPEIEKDAKFYNAAIGVVERNLFSPELDVPFLCREMNMGKTMLTERLKQASGMTPRVFIESVRLEHAAEMLRQGTHRVSEISDLLCFCSPKYFSERFRMKFGCNPKDYK